MKKEHKRSIHGRDLVHHEHRYRFHVREENGEMVVDVICQAINAKTPDARQMISIPDAIIFPFARKLIRQGTYERQKRRRDREQRLHGQGPDTGT